MKKQRRNIINWTPEMIRFIKKNWRRMTNAQMAANLKMKVSTVNNKRQRLGLSKMEMQKWTPEQTKFLQANYKTIGDKELAKIFNTKWEKKKGWTLKHIEKKRMYLGLKRTPAQILRLKKLQGHAIGTIKTISNKYNNKILIIKTKNGYKHYAPILWRQHYGRIPHGYVITFKDGNSQNVTIDNLEMITRQELYLRMSDRKSVFPRAIRNTMKTIKQLNHLIKIKKNERQKFGGKAA